MSTFIIAEIGINHNGDINIAKRLIDGAMFAGCDAVKFQKRTLEIVYSKEELDRPRESPWGTTNREQKMGLEFDRNEYDEIDKYCRERDIEWFASAWDMDSLRFLEAYNSKHNKIASPMLTHKELLRAVARQGKPTFISTGMSTMKQIEKAISIFKEEDCPFELMHCNSVYPMRDKDANLKVIRTLRKRFQCNVGYSGHEVGLITTCAAVTLGATSIERHITLDRAMYGSDQAASVEVIGFYHLVQYIRTIETTFGNGQKRITQEEEKIREKLRKIDTLYKNNEDR